MRRILTVAIVLFLASAALLLAPQRIVAQRAARFERETLNGRDVVAREVLVKFRQQPQASDLAQMRADANMRPVATSRVIMGGESRCQLAQKCAL